MTKISNIEIQFANVAQILAQYPQLKNEIVAFEFTLPIKTADQIKKCKEVTFKLNAFFTKDVLNPVVFEFTNFDEQNIIEGSFIATFPMSGNELDTFLDLLEMNLNNEKEFKFNDYVIVRTTAHKFIMANELI